MATETTPGTTDRDVDTVLGELRNAAAERRAAREALADADPDREAIEAVAEALADVRSVFDRYEDRATDWDDFEGYVRFREALGEQVAALPDDLPHREAFETADEELTTGPQRALSTAEFERAREALAPARELAGRLDRLREARERYRDARHEAVTLRDELQEVVADLDRLVDLGEADLDAPVADLREPVEAYDEAAREAFAALRSEAPARELLATVDDAGAFPLVPFRDPPERLRSYLADADVGREPVSTLLSYADYSRSKLDHYVADPDAFRTAVGAERTYLQRLDGGPLTVGWPPPDADRLRFRVRELVAVLSRFADEATVARARGLRALADRPDYDRLRRSAVARAELDEGERERLRSGAVERERAATSDALDRVEAALDEHPPA
jgi:hypothetical protein